jgi:photosystem I P700 chlorophyll a apoprotein A2
MKRSPHPANVVAGFLVLVLSACQRNPQASPPATTATQPTTTAVTRLETSQPIAETKLEVSQTAQESTLQTAGQQTQTTTEVVVQKALSDLQAQKTNKEIRINLPDNILFDFDKHNLRSTAKPTLQKLSVIINNYQGALVSIYGHTDSKGSDAYNQTLSENRVKSVKDYLTQNFGIAANRLQTQGLGENRPIAPNTNPDGSDNPAGRQKNRRVEVIIHTQTP